MSLHDFNQTNDRLIPLQDHPLGNGSGLGSFHTMHPEDSEPDNKTKILGAAAVALMVGVAGVGLYTQSGSHVQPKAIVTASNQAAPIAAPAPVAAAPDAVAAGSASANVAPSTVDATPASPTKMAVKSDSKSVTPRASRDAGAASARMAADSAQTTQAPAEQSVTALPAAPAPSPSDVARNGSPSNTAVPSDANSASDIPAPQDQAASPAPAQPSAPAAEPAAQ